MSIWLGDTVRYRKKNIIATFGPEENAKVVGVDPTGHRVRLQMQDGSEKMVLAEECDGAA